jgi:C-terminal processing protease CtpA/Prc
MAVGISVVRFRLPDGRSFEGAGLQPDVVVPTRVEDLRAHVDPPYAAVLRMVNARQ